MDFPSRKQIVDEKNLDYRSKIINDIKSIDTDKIDFLNSDFKPRKTIVEKQKIFLWIRLYTKEEVSIDPNDSIKIEYLPSGEHLECSFICYSKKGIEKNFNDQITNYNTEDDKKCLCLMVDIDKINNNDKIPFIRTLFKSGNHFEYQLLRREELIFTNQTKKTTIEYFDVEF